MTPLPAETRIGSLRLSVSSLDRSLDFYQNVIGFQRHGREKDTARLGAGGEDLLALTEKPGGRVAPHTTGLYHFAILLPSRLDLAVSLRHLAETQTPMQGFADHHFSEALYLPDPDGYGIEIYRDRPREDWPSKEIIEQNPNLPLDIDGLVQELEATPKEWERLPTGTTIGHMHLHVRDIDEADDFYQNALGFDPIFRMASASFVSAGGYHHHIGYNIWGTAGASPAPPEALSLEEYSIVLPGQSDLEGLAARLEGEGQAVSEVENGYLVKDPSQNTILLRAENE